MGLNLWSNGSIRNTKRREAQKEGPMNQYTYADQTVNQNITYGLLGSTILTSKKSLRNLSGYTIIIVTDEFMDDTLIRKTAETILSKNCKNVAFCGTASEEWQQIFEETDREINGFNDITGYEDFAVMWRFEDIDMLEDEVSTCWNEVLILCSNMSLIRDCQESLV